MIHCSDNSAELEREIERAERELIEGLSSVVAETCDEAAQHAREVGRFQDQTGALRRGIVGGLHHRTPKGAVGEIASSAPYSSHVEEGTPPHEIRPRSAAALRWVGAGGQVRFAQVVHHPGSPAFPFMGPAYLKAQALLRAKSERLVAKIIARLIGG